MGLRWNGSILGLLSAPSQASAKGVWDLRAHAPFQRDNKWPLFFNSPLDVASVAFWLDASDASTLYDATTGGSLVTAGNTVARWEDKSGNANHVTQSTANNRPTRLAADLNGLDGLDFDGTNDSLNTATAVGNAPLTVFVVAKPDTTANTGRLAHIFGSTYAYQLSASTTFNTRNNQLETSTNSLAWGSVSANTAYVFSAAFSTTDTKGYINNVLGAGGAGSAMGDAGTVTTIGARADLVAATYYNGKIYEIVAFTTAFTDAQRNAMAAYFSRKWGIT
jgi:hypothetical protein